MSNDLNVVAVDGFERSIPWLDPTPEMLERADFEVVWQTIKKWDVNVPQAYSGYCGATGNHVRAILDALDQNSVKTGEYISPVEMKRLHSVCIAALQRYDVETQFDHLFEEIGELIIAKTRRWRNRSTDEDILEELVDVFQCVTQMGVHHFGVSAFNAMLKRKNDKFIAKIMEGDLVKVSKKKTTKRSKNKK